MNKKLLILTAVAAGGVALYSCNGSANAQQLPTVEKNCYVTVGTTACVLPGDPMEAAYDADARAYAEASGLVYTGPEVRDVEEYIPPALPADCVEFVLVGTNACISPSDPEFARYEQMAADYAKFVSENFDPVTGMRLPGTVDLADPNWTPTPDVAISLSGVEPSTVTVTAVEPVSEPLDTTVEPVVEAVRTAQPVVAAAPAKITPVAEPTVVPVFNATGLFRERLIINGTGYLT